MWHISDAHFSNPSFNNMYVIQDQEVAILVGVKVEHKQHAKKTMIM